MSVQINVQASQTALAQSIQQGIAAFNARYAGQNQLNLQINQRSFSQPLGRITSDLADFESALKASNARVLAFGASTAVLGGVAKAFKEIANVTIEVEKSLTDINRVLNLSTNNLQKFSSELFSISKQTASSFDDATKAALEFSRQGLNTEETLKRTADALTLVRLTGISSTKAVEDLTATINGFSKAGLTTSQVVNKLAAVEQDFAVSASDLTEALSRTGQAAQEAGVSFDELNALVTTAQQNTARGGAVIGNALKTIFTRLQRTETLDQLQNFNIAVRDIEGNILPAVQILKNFADRYNDLADAQRAQLSEQVAGVYQVNILKGVIKDLNNNQGTYVQALQRGAMAANEADIANQRLNKTLSALVTQTGIGLQQLANNVGKVTFAPIFEAIVSPVNDAVTYINDTLEGEGIGSVFANGLLKGVRNVIAGPGLAVAFAVIAKVAKNTFEDATKALPAILGLTTEAQKRANIEKSIISILQTQSNLSLALQGQQGNLSTQAATVLNYAKLQTAQYQQQLQIAQQLAPLLAAQNVTVGARGIQVGPRIKAGGHIPAFAEMSERMGAAMGGYKSGKVVKAPTSVGANTYMNSAEEVKYVSGFAQPFINPPANSKAGRTHRKNAINRTGIDPYMAGGFIPNFAEVLNVSKDPYTVKDGDTITADATIKRIRDFRLEQIDAIESNQLLGNDATNLAKKIFPNSDSFTPTINASGKAAYDRLTFISTALSDKLVDKGLGVPDLRYISGDTYINRTLWAKKEKNGIWSFIDSSGNYTHPKAIQFLTQMGLSKESDEDLRSEGMYKAARKGRKKFLNSGFIPNFAPPTSAIRVPWFKKFGNPAFDTIQPTLGISKASDTDTFRSSQFRSKAFEKAATDGDPNLFAPLYEDFIFKALQLVSQPKIKDQLIRGYVNQPGTDQKQSAFDAFLGDVGLEFKGFPKSNLTGSISKNLNDKYERYAKANPTGAAKIKESIIAFNEIGDKNQLPSDFGKNFSQLAGTSYSEMAKNYPDLVKALSAETNALLQRYIKDPAFLAMSAANGFIPNFASRREMFRDLIKFNLDSAPNNQNILGGKTTLFRGVRNNKNSIFGQSRNYSQTENSRDYFRNTDIDKIANDHVLEKKLLPFISASTDKDIAEYFARGRRDDDLLGSGAVGSKTIKNSRIFSEQSIRKFIDKYGEKALKDIMLELSNWGSLGYGKGMAINFQSFSQKKGFEGTDFAKEISFLSNGFIPNLANFIDVDTLGKNSVHYSGDLMKLIKDIEASIGRNLSSGELRFLTNPKTDLSKLNDPKILNRFINSERKGGFAQFAKGLIPNFAYKQAVMALEEGMSGKNAILDTTTGPFPFIRNSGQSNFASAISDHGGLKNALNDSMRNQEAAGLMSNGFVPNFAVVKARQSLGADFGSLSKTEQTLFLQLNIALTKLAKDTTLTSQQQQALQNTIQNNALMLQQSTKSINIVNDANNALVKSLQENAQAQSAAAQSTRAAAGTSSPRAAQQTLSTRIGGLLGGARGAVRGRRFDRMLGGLSNNVGFTMAAPLLGGVAESFIAGGKDRSEMGYAQRLASTGASATLSGLSTGAAIGTAIPGIGTAAGAAIGALVGFTGAAMNAKTNLNDLSKSINDIIDRNKKDIDSAKTIGQLEKQIAGETDPFAIAVLRMKIQEAADNISNTEFAKKLLSTTQSVEEFNKVINEFTLSSGPLNQLGNLPSLIQSFAKKTKTRETSSGLDAFLNFSERNSIFFAKQFEKNKNKAVALAGTFFDPIGIAFTNIQDQIEKTSPQAAKDFGDILNNIFELKKSGQLENKLKNLVDTNALSKELADEFAKFINETDNEYFDQYLKNLSIRLPIIRNNVKKDAVAQSGRIADSESLKKMFAKINDEIQNALNEAALQLMNIEFKSNIGKLNIEKIGGIFDTAASAIGKNLESIAKSQFDALMVQIQLSREAQLADLNRTQFEETRSQEMNKYLAERKSRVSTFFEKNIAPGKESRDMASQALAKIGSDLTYDFKNLESLAYNMGVDVENARKELIRNEEYQKNLFQTQASNAKIIFDQEQSYAKDLRDLKKKAAEEDLKLEEIKYANLLKEKQIIQSFDFANQARQIQTQAEVSRMGMGMEVNPNFFAGASRFQQEDYKFRLDRQKQEKQMAAEIRTATEQQRIVDIQRQVMSANTDATNENTKAIREYTLQLLNNRLTDVRKGLSSLESSNVSAAISKAITSEPNNTALYQTPNLAEDFRFYKYNYIPEQKASFTYDRNIIAGMDSNLQKSTEQNKPKGFFTQLYNAWTGNQKANQLPLETRSMEELIKADEEKNRITRGEIPARVINTDFQAKEYKKSDTPLMLQNLRDSNKEISVQREITLQNQKQVDLQNQEKSIVEDINSLRKARISTIKSSVASISPDQKRIGLANDELTRLNKQIELNQSQLDKLQVERNQTQETERQAQLDQQILDLQDKINKGKLDELNYTEQIKNIEEARKKYAEYMASRGKFSTGVAKAMGSIKDETEMFKETLGTTTVNAFRDGLVGAMDAALNKADDLESALMGVAAGFLREIQGVMLRNIANNIVGGIGSAFSFGQPAATKQKGGLIRAQKGMYISGGRTGDKNPALLEDGEYVLNRNAVKALGGPSAIDQLNFNAFPRFADGGDPGTMSASAKMNEPFERLSMYGREQSPEYQAYVERLREAEAAREKKRAERKALLNQFLTTLITTGLMMGVESGVKGLKSKFGSKTPLNKVAGSKPNLAQRAQLKKAGVGIGPDGLPIMQTGGVVGFNKGGFLPYGSRLTDSIPAYLTGGEYVVNSRAVRKYGVGGLNRINSGIAKFQDGGMVSDGINPSQNTSNTSNSNISINITVNATNGKVGDQESDTTGDGTEGNSKELSNRIKAVVLDVITSEQRTGGLLDSTKKK